MLQTLYEPPAMLEVSRQTAICCRVLVSASIAPARSHHSVTRDNLAHLATPSAITPASVYIELRDAPRHHVQRHRVQRRRAVVSTATAPCAHRGPVSTRCTSPSSWTSRPYKRRAARSSELLLQAQVHPGTPPIRCQKGCAARRQGHGSSISKQGASSSEIDRCLGRYVARLLDGTTGQHFYRPCQQAICVGQHEKRAAVRYLS